MIRKNSSNLSLERCDGIIAHWCIDVKRTCVRKGTNDRIDFNSAASDGVCNTWNNYTINWHCLLKSVIIETWSPSPHYTVDVDVDVLLPLLVDIVVVAHRLIEAGVLCVHCVRPMTVMRTQWICYTLLYYLYTATNIRKKIQHSMVLVFGVWYSIALWNNPLTCSSTSS